jgi:hypothetical protein
MWKDEGQMIRAFVIPSLDIRHSLVIPSLDIGHCLLCFFLDLIEDAAFIEMGLLRLFPSAE